VKNETSNYDALADQIEEHLRELDHSGPTLALTVAAEMLRAADATRGAAMRQMPERTTLDSSTIHGPGPDVEYVRADLHDELRRLARAVVDAEQNYSRSQTAQEFHDRTAIRRATVEALRAHLDESEKP
jgi:hypothetical protein